MFAPTRLFQRAVAAVGLLTLGVWVGLAAGQKPNILYIIADDMSADAVSFAALQASLGNGASQAGSINTPTIDALANQGTTFVNAYNQGGWSGAVCVTSRTAIMTGRSMWNAPGSNQAGSAVDNANTLPGLFNAAGYDTARFGKSGNDYNNATNTFTTHSESDQRGETASQWFADQGIAYLNGKVQANDSDPYLLYLGLSSPHDPRNAPQSFLDLHGAKNGSPAPSAPLSGYDPLPSAYLGAAPFDNGHLNVRDENSVDGAGQNRDERTIRNEISKNHAVIEYMDSQIKRVIDTALEYEGLTPGVNDISDLQNTLIVFTSDHGMSIGRHGLVGKQNIYEHTLRVPYIVAGAVGGVPVNTGVSDKNIYLHDSLPTLLDLAGVATDPSVQAESFAAALSTDQATRDAFAGHEVVYGAYSPSPSNHIQRSVKMVDGAEAWKVIHYPQINRTQLFNLTSDPDETDDLSHDPQYTAVLNELAETMDEQQAQWNDPARGQLGRIGINMAYGKTATQSSGASAGMAVNGAGAVQSTLPGGIGGGTTLVRTDAAQTGVEDNPWWMVDLGSSQTIGEIALHNTLDNDAALRLSDIRVEILDPAMNPVYASGLLTINGSDDWLTIDLNNNAKVGQYVRVTRESAASVLALDEVQVFTPGWVAPPDPQAGEVNIQWRSAQNTAGLGDLTLAKSGNIVAAYTGGPSDVVVDGVSFVVNNLPNGSASEALQGASSGDAPYDGLLDSFTYGGGTQTSLEFTGLTAGKLYAVQAWFTDLREAVDGRTMTFASALGNSVDVVGNPAGPNPPDYLGQYAVGMFVATEETARVLLETNGFGNAHYNAALAFEPRLGDLSDVTGVTGRPDGAIDANDWRILRDNMFSDAAVGLSPIEAYLLGDLTLDGVIDIDDFSAFKAAYLSQAGATPEGFAALTSVPEPAGLAAIVVGCLAALVGYRR
ncbi:Choline-sulfatase [Pirellulimonas nuda]|uniref:Choline-sulfatase n=1 Tax=Pirellulimonas nuda TaxID=2528009 RepID=A0A518D8Y3_9BACT|nr:sulfatase-like hydrolase/transferase [Pirellulimonas nuda]QDU87910.1 Choline-sulfatase [Pirellulimonas nuda]